MGKKKTHEEFMRDFKERQPENFEKIEVLGVYVKSSEKIKCRCKIDGYEWEVVPSSLLLGHGCPKCTNCINKTHKQFMEEFEQNYPENFNKIDILGTYKNNKTKIKCKCKIDGCEWEPTPIALLYGQGCPICGKKKSILSRTKTHKEFIDELKKINPNIKIIGEYINTHSVILCECKIDGFKWNATPHNLLHGSKCPKCSKSQTSLFEQVIYETFKEVLGKDKVLHRDKFLIGKELDIYIPSLKIAFEPGSWFWHSDKTHNDYDKYLLCKEKGVKLITIYDGMKEDFNLEFEYNVVKYEKNINKEEIKEFIINQFKELELDCKIKWNKIFKEASLNCMSENELDFKNRLSKIHPNIEYIEGYINSQIKVKCKCKIDGYEWYARPADLTASRKRGCPKCGGTLKLNHNEFIDRVSKINPNIEILDKYINNRTKIRCRCKIDGNIWETIPDTLMSGHGCPLCGKKKMVETRRRNAELKKIQEQKEKEEKEN